MHTRWFMHVPSLLFSFFVRCRASRHSSYRSRIHRYRVPICRNAMALCATYTSTFALSRSRTKHMCLQCGPLTHTRTLVARASVLVWRYDGAQFFLQVYWAITDSIFNYFFLCWKTNIEMKEREKKRENSHSTWHGDLDITRCICV